MREEVAVTSRACLSQAGCYDQSNRPHVIKSRVELQLPDSFKPLCLSR